MVTEGIVVEQAIDTAKQEEYAHLMMDFFCEEFCSCLFVLLSYNKSYGHLKEQQHNTFLMGDNKNTGKNVEAKTLIEDWQGPYSM